MSTATAWLIVLGFACIAAIVWAVAYRDSHPPTPPLPPDISDWDKE